MSRTFWLLLVVFAVILLMPISAQPSGQGDPALRNEDAPDPDFQGQRPDMMGQQEQGMRPGMRPGMQHGQGMRPGMRPGMQEHGPGMGPREGDFPRGMDAETQKMMERHNSAMAMAEAYKQLSSIYEQQGKIDEAAGELKKILTLMASDSISGKNPERERQKIAGKLVPVYHEIARLYLQNNRIGDAEKIINEGITRFSVDDPAAASRLLLHLGEIYKNSKELDKAAENYKRVIEMNQKVLDKK